ncbi:MAG: PfkB family carbohydrate kinase [Solirubrobacteraceae bacterium]
MTRIAVVGHVEWVQFLRVDHLPMRGEIQSAHRESAHAGGGAVVAAATLAELGAQVEFFGAVGSDALGDAAVAELAERGITVHAARRPGPSREVITLLDRAGDRTILPIGERLQPHGADALDWGRLAQADGVYVTAGDAGALRHARAAGVLVATPRLRERLECPDVYIDALVFSATDENEVGWAERLRSETRLMVATEGEHGGRWWGESEGRWKAAPPPGPVRDSYGCGDAFAAGFTYGLGAGRSVAEAAALGAAWGAEMLTRVGAP